VSVIDDPALVDQIREHDVTLDLCPTSNVQAGVVASIEEHPIAELHRAGVSVTISTDDLTVTGTTLSAELARVATAHALTRDELSAIALNAFDRAFTPPAALAAVTAEARSAWDAWRAAGIS
jgi:adenosine deaminase